AAPRRAADLARARARLARAAAALPRVLAVGIADIASPAILTRRGCHSSGPRRRGLVHMSSRLVTHGRVPGSLRDVVRGSGRIPTAHERERTEADGGSLRRRRHGRRALAARHEANQRLDPRRAAEAGGHAAQTIPETPAGAQEKRANGRRAEGELGGKLDVAEPADLPQEE